MNSTYRNDDELLSAYMDGELPADESAALVKRLVQEPALTERLEAMRSGDEAVRAMYRQLDHAPLPESVARMLDLPGSDSKIVSFRARGMPSFFSMPVAIAASVALIAGFVAIRQLQTDPAPGTADALVAGQIDDTVNELLETGLSGQPETLGEAAEMQIVLSFQNDAGNYCRQLSISETGRSIHGVACQGASGWQLEAIAIAAPDTPDGRFRTATAETPEAVAGVVDALIGDRQPLTKDEETVLISTNWK